MTPEKASTLRLLKEGMGQPVNLVASRDGANFHEIRANLPEISVNSLIPVMFLVTTLSFLEASLPGEDPEEDRGPDGWTPADFLSHLRFDQGSLKVSLDTVRGRSVYTDVELTPKGELTIMTRGRGQSATRWLAYVEGRSHLRPVGASC